MSIIDAAKKAKQAADLDVAATVQEFLTLLRGMDSKLSELLELEKAREARERGVCGDCEQVGRLRCPRHGPVMVPTLESTR